MNRLVVNAGEKRLLQKKLFRSAIIPRWKSCSRNQPPHSASKVARGQLHAPLLPPGNFLSTALQGGRCLRAINAPYIDMAKDLCQAPSPQPFDLVDLSNSWSLTPRSLRAPCTAVVFGSQQRGQRGPKGAGRRAANAAPSGARPRQRHRSISVPRPR